MNGIARRTLGHLLGIVSCLIVVAHAPRIMDGAVCVFTTLFTAQADKACTMGSARLGEGGLPVTWLAVASLGAVAAIMELLLWLRAWYRAPAWLGALVLFLGCPALLSVVTLALGTSRDDALFIGLVAGLPIALATTAYWVALVVCGPPTWQSP